MYDWSYEIINKWSINKLRLFNWRMLLFCAMIKSVNRYEYIRIRKNNKNNKQNKKLSKAQTQN